MKKKDLNNSLKALKHVKISLLLIIIGAIGSRFTEHFLILYALGFIYLVIVLILYLK